MLKAGRPFLADPILEPIHHGFVDSIARYRETRDRMAAEYKKDELAWAKKAWLNICYSGRFSSDRTIADYANEVWKIQPTPISQR